MDSPPQFLASLLGQLPPTDNLAKRTLILAMLTDRVSVAHRPDLVGRILAHLGLIGDPEDRSAIWLALARNAAGNLQPGFYARSLEAARAIDDTRTRKEALAGLIRSAPDLFLGQIADAIRSERHPSIRSELMLALAPRLPDPSRRPFLAEILETLLRPQIVEGRDGRPPRTAYYAQLSGAAFKILPEGMIGRAWELVRAIEPLCDWDDAFEAILPHLPDSMLDQAEAEAAGPRRRGGGFWAAIALADRSLGREAALELRTARHLDFHINSRFRLHELARSAWGQPEGRKAQLFAESLDRVAEIGSNLGRILATGWLIPRLPERALVRAFSIAQQIDANIINCPDPLLLLAERSSGSLRRAALDRAFDSAFERRCYGRRPAFRLRRIADCDGPGPPWPRLAEALGPVAAEDPGEFLDCLVAILPWLDHHLTEADWLEIGRQLA